MTAMMRKARSTKLAEATKHRARRAAIEFVIIRREERRSGVCHPGTKWREHSRTEAAVDTILSNIGAVPKWINRRRLREEIDRAGQWYRTREKLYRPADAKRRTVRLQDIVRAADKLTLLLSGDDGEWCARQLVSHFPLYELQERVRGIEKSASVDGLRSGLKRLSRRAQRMLWNGEVSPEPVWPLGVSLFEWYISQQLAPIYKRWFGRIPGASQDPNGKKPPSGPFIRFCQMVLLDQKITNGNKPYTPHSIAAALSATPARRSRGYDPRQKLKHKGAVARE